MFSSALIEIDLIKSAFQNAEIARVLFDQKY